ncbi:sugar ABC transporter substrate-binding protein [Photobacterium sanctipauli]|uniref:Sugar ABC transporter substrate-binding protein n=1 Tax=Photobacterium sanctipauli TaxID=1342794 RepID=A0A2T3NSD8_9GAMM|nr:SLBB domain-containing protein [Photobacterium sanctipauli]PSW19162.1 sugar ABC transporter substrate-binding protein [Photobacterium sanctipauli]
MSRLLLLLLILCIPPALGGNLTPGDRVFLQLPGESDFDKPFTIDDQGQIQLPEIGLVNIAGLSLKEAEQRLRDRLNTVYRNLDEFKLSILEQVLRVQVLGYVEEPGMISLKPDSNIQMAITAAGGARPGAQLDQFKLIRNGQAQQFNYKAYLDGGGTNLLPSLQGGDTIFVPTSPLLGNVEVDFDAASLREGGDANEEQGITIFGELRNPGTFSFKPGMTVVDALMRADGVTRYADVTKIRVITDNVPYQFDLKSYLDTGETKSLPPIAPGSTIFAPIEVEDINTTSRTVYVMGEVKAPGAYESTPDTGFVDVLANAGGPTRFADTTQIKLLRAAGAPIALNLVTYTQNPASYSLPDIAPGDVIFVPEKIDFNEKSWLKVTGDRAIKIIGAVNNPGRFEWNNSMGFLDVLSHAGGPKQQANLSNIRLLRDQPGGGNNVIYFDLESFIYEGGSFSQLPSLSAGDTIIIDELPHDPTDNKSSWIRQSADDSIYIFGQVGAPGRYAFNKELGFLDILSAADGPNGDADLRQIRISHRNENTAKVSHLNLSLYFETGDESLLPKVVPGDVIYVPKEQGNWLDKPAEQVVRLMGSVNKPGRYTFNNQMNILDLLAEAGGPSDSAYIERIMIVNTSCCGDKTQTFNLRDYVIDPARYPLPLLRPGDTVYVPNINDSVGEQWRQGLRDILGIFTLIALGAAL